MLSKDGFKRSAASIVGASSGMQTHSNAIGLTESSSDVDPVLIRVAQEQAPENSFSYVLELPAYLETSTVPGTGSFLSVTQTPTIHTPGDTQRLIKLGFSNESVTTSLTLADSQTPFKTVTLDAADALSGSYALKFPASQGPAKSYFENDGAGNLSFTRDLHVTALELEDAQGTPSSVTISAPSAVTTTYALTLPPAQGGVDTVAVNDGSGALTWQIPVPIGSIIPFGSTTLPAGFLLCDGSAVSRTTYSALFTAIASNFGSGDGSSTFNVPDLRGMFLRGVSGSSGRDPNSASRVALASGGNSGDNIGSYLSDRFASHTHTPTVQGHNHTVNDTRNSDDVGFAAFDGTNGAAAPNETTTSQTTSTVTVGVSIANTGDGAETVPKSVLVNYIIKYGI